MEIKTFNTQNPGTLVLGHAGEHNATTVRFEGFEREAAGNIVYVMLGAPIDRMIPLSTDLAFVVQTNVTGAAGRFEGELLETDAEGNLVKKSPVFYCVVKEALDPTEEIEVTDPSLDLLYAELYQTYVEIKTAYESGAFKGEKGEPGAPGAPGEPGTDGITGGAVEYSTEEKAIGTWVDGSTVYRKCFVLDAPVTLDAGSYTRIFDASEMKMVIDWKIVSTDKTIRTGMYNSPSDKGAFAIGYNVGYPLPAGSVIIVEYLK